MSKWIKGSVCALLMINGYIAFAQTGDTLTDPESMSQGATRIYFYKLSGKKVPTYTPIYMNDYKIFSLKKDSLIYVDLTPGIYDIHLSGSTTMGKETLPTDIKIYLEEGKQYFFKISPKKENEETPAKYVLDMIAKDSALKDMENLKHETYKKKKKPIPLNNPVIKDILDNVDKKEISTNGLSEIYVDKDFDFKKIDKISIYPLVDARDEKKHELEKLFMGFQVSEKIWDEKASHLLDRINIELIKKGYFTETLFNSIDENINTVEMTRNYNITELVKIGNQNVSTMMLSFVNQIKYTDFLGKGYNGISLTFALIDKKESKLLWMGQGSLTVDDLTSDTGYGGIFGVMKNATHAI